MMQQGNRFTADRNGFSAPSLALFEVAHHRAWIETTTWRPRIVDEIPSGLGKTGGFFAHQRRDVLLDMVELVKTICGGMLPFAAVIADCALDVVPDYEISLYTHAKILHWQGPR